MSAHMRFFFSQGKYFLESEDSLDTGSLY